MPRQSSHMRALFRLHLVQGRHDGPTTVSTLLHIFNSSIATESYWNGVLETAVRRPFRLSNEDGTAQDERASMIPGM